MPAVSITGGSRGNLYWACGSECARIAEIEVLCRPHTDHFSRSFKGSELHVQKVTINDARGRDTSIDHGTMDESVEGDKIGAQKFEDSLLHLLRIGRVGKTRLNSCTS